MKHRTLRCAAETLVLLLIAAMAVFLAAGLHQRAPDGALSTLSTGWYQLTDGVRREVTLPAALETGPGQTITLYNDTLTDSDGGKVLSARGVEYGIEIRAGETLLYRYEDNAFPKNAQMKGRLWADAELPYGIGGQTLSLTFTELPGRMCRIDAPVLGSMPAVTGRHIQSSLFSVGMILVMLVLAVLALLIFLYMSFYGIRERRFLDTAVFLLLCSLWCMTDSSLYQLYGADTAAGSVVSFYAFMTMAIPMVHFVRNTVSGRLRLVPDVLIALLCVNALAQGAAYRLFGVPFIHMLPLTHLLLTAGVAAMLTVLFRSYRAQPAPQLRLRMAAFAALGVFGVAALVLYWLLHIYWYDAVYQFGVLLFIILLLHGLISQTDAVDAAAELFLLPVRLVERPVEHALVLHPSAKRLPFAAGAAVRQRGFRGQIHGLCAGLVPAELRQVDIPEQVRDSDGEQDAQNDQRNSQLYQGKAAFSAPLPVLFHYFCGICRFLHRSAQKKPPEQTPTAFLQFNGFFTAGGRAGRSKKPPAIPYYI